jgi:hypothetical protein
MVLHVVEDIEIANLWEHFYRIVDPHHKIMND